MNGKEYIFMQMDEAMISEKLDTERVIELLGESIHGLEKSYKKLLDIKSDSSDTVRIGKLDDNIELLNTLIKNIKGMDIIAIQ